MRHGGDEREGASRRRRRTTSGSRSSATCATWPGTAASAGVARSAMAAHAGAGRDDTDERRALGRVTRTLRRRRPYWASGETSSSRARGGRWAVQNHRVGGRGGESGSARSAASVLAVVNVGKVRSFAHSPRRWCTGWWVLGWWPHGLTVLARLVECLVRKQEILLVPSNSEAPPSTPRCVRREARRRAFALNPLRPD